MLKNPQKMTGIVANLEVDVAKPDNFAKVQNFGKVYYNVTPIPN